MSKKLVAYFSASGVTASLAKRLAKTAEADIFEIKPLQPYTKSDLDWQDKNSRSSVEMSDKSSRPAIAEKIGDIAQYDVILVGFPIWWYIAPTIINTFLEQYDLTGKTVIPFATSGGSNMGDTNAMLALSCKGAVLKEGRRFSADESERGLAAWLEELDV